MLLNKSGIRFRFKILMEYPYEYYYINILLWLAIHLTHMTIQSRSIQSLGTCTAMKLSL